MKFDNWDKSCWISSDDYIKSVSTWVLKELQVSGKGTFLDLGCGRGMLSRELATQSPSLVKVIGVDICDRLEGCNEENLELSRADVVQWAKCAEDDSVNWVMLKQFLHLLRIDDQKKLLSELKRIFTPRGKGVILQLGSEISAPLFGPARESLERSIQSHQDTLQLLLDLGFNVTPRLFSYKVKMQVQEWCSLLRGRYMSCLSTLSEDELEASIPQVETAHEGLEDIQFEDKLDAFVFENAS